MEEMEEIRLSIESDHSMVQELKIPTINATTISEPVTPVLVQIEPLLDSSYNYINQEQLISSQDYLIIMEQVKQGILEGHQPRRIETGSSGSYFCYDKYGKSLGVYKPKDEEPYGNLNPKWTKWIHRNLFPCCFGRSSLIPNLGYLSEASASLIDRSLNLGLVPRTEIVRLSSSSFHYSKKDFKRFIESDGKINLPLKMGSFQLFLNNYLSANQFFINHPWPKSIDNNVNEPMLNNDVHSIDAFWNKKRMLCFRLELEKLIVFDYLIRNTDRSLDNWMIKILPNSEIRISAIDHGLAFPHKHPDNWRSYPYGWLKLPLSLIDQPFHKLTRAYILPLLTSEEYWNDLELKLLKLNKIDNDFNFRMFKNQLQVIKGQAYNLIQSLKNLNHGPLQLCNIRPKIVEELEVLDLDSNQMDNFNLNLDHIITPNKDILLGKDPKLCNFKDPFSDKIISNNPSTKKKVMKKLKEITRRPCFASC